MKSNEASGLNRFRRILFSSVAGIAIVLSIGSQAEVEASSVGPGGLQVGPLQEGSVRQDVLSLPPVNLERSADPVLLLHDWNPDKVELGCILSSGAVVLIGRRTGNVYLFSGKGELENLVLPNLESGAWSPDVTHMVEYGAGGLATRWRLRADHGPRVRVLPEDGKRTHDIELKGRLLCGLKGRPVLIVLKRGGSIFAETLARDVAGVRVAATVGGRPVWCVDGASAADGTFALLARTYEARSREPGALEDVARYHLLVFDADLNQVSSLVLPLSLGSNALSLDYDGEHALVGVGAKGIDTGLWWIDCASGSSRSVRLSPLEGRIDPLWFRLHEGGLIGLGSDTRRVEFFRVR